MKNQALFLDRDGVINVDKGYVYKKEDFEFCEGIFEFCTFFIQKKFQLFIITNQSGIARAYYSEADFAKLSAFMCEEFEKRGIKISRIYHCPHLKNCECRKPKPNMILKAKEEFNINLKASFLVGDKLSDIEAGFKAGVGTLYLLGKEKGAFFETFKDLKELLANVKMHFNKGKKCV